MKLFLAVPALAVTARAVPFPPANEALEPYCYDACPEVGLEPYCCRRVMHTREGALRAKSCRAYPKSHRSFEDFEEACFRSGGGMALCCETRQRFEHRYMCAEPAGFGVGGPRAGLEKPPTVEDTAERKLEEIKGEEATLVEDGLDDDETGEDVLDEDNLEKTEPDEENRTDGESLDGVSEEDKPKEDEFKHDGAEWSKDNGQQGKTEVKTEVEDPTEAGSKVNETKEVQAGNGRAEEDELKDEGPKDSDSEDGELEDGQSTGDNPSGGEAKDKQLGENEGKGKSEDGKAKKGDKKGWTSGGGKPKGEPYEAKDSTTRKGKPGEGKSNEGLPEEGKLQEEGAGGSRPNEDGPQKAEDGLWGHYTLP